MMRIKVLLPFKLRKRLSLILICMLTGGIWAKFSVSYIDCLPLMLSPLATAAVLAWSWRIHRTYLSPPAVLSIAWLLPPLLTYLDPCWHLVPYTWFIIYASFIAFFFGYALCLVNPKGYIRKIHLPQVDKLRLWPRNTMERVIYCLFIFGMLGFAVGLFHIFQQGGLQIYWKLGFRQAEHIFGSNPLANYLFFLNMLVVVLTAAYIRLYSARLKVILIGLISFVTLFFHGIRGTVIYTLIIATYATLLVSKRVKIRAIVIVIATAFFVFGLVMFGRDPAMFKSFTPAKVLEAILGEMYLYVAPNFANLQQEILFRDKFLYGKATFRPFLKVVTLDGKLFPLPEPPNFLLLNASYNVGTYLRNFYVDFGIAGVLLFPFLLGLATTAIFVHLARYKTMRGFFTYAIMLTMITATFWFNEFLRIQFLYFIALVWLIDLGIGVPARKKEALQ